MVFDELWFALPVPAVAVLGLVGYKLLLLQIPHFIIG